MINAIILLQNLQGQVPLVPPLGWSRSPRLLLQRALFYVKECYPTSQNRGGKMEPVEMYLHKPPRTKLRDEERYLHV